MSRYTGPRVRAMRAVGSQLPGLSSKSYERRPYPPGQHGQGRKKVSEYGLRLKEKQKLCLNYGVTERKLRRLMVQARAAKGPTGDRLLELLERSLDNVVFRAGLARTIPAARQLVNHGHVTVDGRRVDRAGFLVRTEHVVGLRERSQGLTLVTGALDAAQALDTPWLRIDKQKRTATVCSLPEASSVPFPIEVQLVVEFYSQRV